MNKLHVLETILVISTFALSLIVLFNYLAPPKIQTDPTSEEMRDEIIRQLKEKGEIV